MSYYRIKLINTDLFENQLSIALKVGIALYLTSVGVDTAFNLSFIYYLQGCSEKYIWFRFPKLNTERLLFALVIS